MKFIIAVLLGLSGCAQVDDIYGTGKKVYKVGREVAPVVPMSEKTRTTLVVVDKVAVKYDAAREAIRIEENATSKERE